MKGRLRQVKRTPALPSRRPDAHKGDFGRVLVVGGSVGMAGAASLAANAALRGGAGLVRVACPAPVLPTVAALCPCATTMSLPADAAGRFSQRAVKDLLAAADEHDVLAIGPGMGQSAGLVRLVGELISQASKPAVIDADGLNNLARVTGWPRRRAPGAPALLLTPHPGEMKRLLAAAQLGVEAGDRVAAASRLAAWCGQVVVLKGAGTLVCDGRRLYTNRTGNPGMATGGSGDVLTGLIAALLAQGLAPFEAAALGVHLHGLAGDLAAAELGQVSLTAADLLDYLPAAFHKHHTRSRS